MHFDEMMLKESILAENAKMRSGYSGRSIKREMFRDVHFWHETSGGPEGFHHWTQFRKGGLKLGNSDPVTALTSECLKRLDTYFSVKMNSSGEVPVLLCFEVACIWGILLIVKAVRPGQARRAHAHGHCYWRPNDPRFGSSCELASVSCLL